ncbi:MAG TPA: hypothetical protein PLP27_12520 [Crocinitomicaceae bacterium]|nr:hypothetical protein [Crocinitomicaceae bacterium]
MKKTKEELKRELLQWVKNQNWTNRKFVSIPIGQIVEFTASGIKHTISRNYKNFPEVEIQMAKNIMAILPNSFYMGFDRNTDKKRAELKGVHNFYDIVKFEDSLYEVWFKVKETRDKTYFYDHGIIKKL